MDKKTGKRRGVECRSLSKDEVACRIDVTFSVKAREGLSGQRVFDGLVHWLRQAEAAGAKFDDLDLLIRKLIELTGKSLPP